LNVKNVDSSVRCIVLDRENDEWGFDVLHDYTASVLAAFVLVLQKVQLLRVDGTTTARDKTQT
jgi:hypothetical protein